MVCVGVRVHRCKTGLSHRVSLEVLCGMCRGQGSHVTQSVVGGRLVGVGVRVRRFKTVRVRRSRTGLSHRVSLEV